MNSLDKNNAGFSLLEVLVVLGLFAIITGAAVINLKELANPLANTAFNITHYLRLVRSKAMSQTIFYRVAPLNNSNIAAYTGASCAGPWTAAENLDLDLDDGITLTDTEWWVCFTPRGIADEHITFSFSGTAGTKTVEIALGGGVRVQ